MAPAAWLPPLFHAWTAVVNDLGLMLDQSAPVHGKIALHPHHLFFTAPVAHDCVQGAAIAWYVCGSGFVRYKTRHGLPSAGWQAFGEIGGWLALCAYKQQRRLSVEITDCEKYRTVACAFGDEYATKDAFFWPASS